MKLLEQSLTQHHSPLTTSSLHRVFTRSAVVTAPQTDNFAP